MIKEFKIGTSVFTIKVILNTKVEKRINGKRWHTIHYWERDDRNFNKTFEVEDSELIESIKNIEKKCQEYVANKHKFKPFDERLAMLGFKH